MLPGMGGGLDGGGTSAPGAGPTMSLGMGGAQTNVDPPAVTPQTHTNVDPPAVVPPSSAPAVSPKVLPNPPTTPDALPYAPATAPKGFDGGDLGSPAGAAPAGGGVMSKVGLDGGATAAGPGQFFAEGGAVDDDGADPQGAMGNDPYTQLISAAMDSVDKTFEYGRQKNGLGQQGKQAPQGAPKPPSDEPDGDGDDMPGANAASDDGDQDDEGAA